MDRWSRGIIQPIVIIFSFLTLPAVARVRCLAPAPAPAAPARLWAGGRLGSLAQRHQALTSKCHVNTAMDMDMYMQLL